MKVVERGKTEPRRVLDARQLGTAGSENNPVAMVAWITENGGEASRAGANVSVRTPMGLVVVAPNSWITRSAGGCFGVCAPEIFEEVYEPLTVAAQAADSQQGVAMDIKTKAFVIVKVEVECGLWHGESQLNQVFNQAGKEAVEKVQQLVRGSLNMKVVGEPAVTAVTTTK